MTLKEDASFFESNHCAVTVGQLKAGPILTELAVVFWFLLTYVSRSAEAFQSASIQLLT